MRVDKPAPLVVQLGVSGANVRCLLLLPLAYVAAMSRRRDHAALDVLFEAVAGRAGLDSEGVEIARRWLREVPSMEQLEAGLLHLRRLRDSRDPVLTPGDLLASVIWAGNAAQLDRGAAGMQSGALSSQARHAMRDLATWLGVDIGEVWADVLAELGEELPRSGNMLPPRFKTLPESSRYLVSDAAPLSIPFPLVRRAAQEQAAP